MRAKFIGASFYHASAEINNLQEQIVQFYADNFTNGNIQKAKRLLEEKKEFIRTEEVSQISFSVGLLTLAIPLNIFLLCVEDTQWLSREPASDIGNWLNIGYIFRFFLFADIIIFGAASIVQILKAYKINYIYIFEIEPRF